MKFFVSITFLSLLSACSGKPPFLEYTLAHSALKSAKKVRSMHHANRPWGRAVYYYNKAEENFRDRHYMSARRFFNESLKWAEKAEQISRFKINSGEDR